VEVAGIEPARSLSLRLRRRGVFPAQRHFLSPSSHRRDMDVEQFIATKLKPGAETTPPAPPTTSVNSSRLSAVANGPLDLAPRARRDGTSSRSWRPDWRTAPTHRQFDTSSAAARLKPVGHGRHEK
jgi:hypothetical protein